MSGYIEQRGPNTFRLVSDLPKGTDGKRQRVTTTFHGTKREAKRALAEFVIQSRQRPTAIGGEMLLRDFCEREWLPAAKRTIGAKTLEQYERILERDVFPVLGNRKLQDIERRDVQHLIDGLVTRGRRDGRPGTLSARSVVHVHRVLHRAFVQAIRAGRLDRNSAEHINLPRIQVKEPSVPDVAQTTTLLKLLEGTRLHLPVLIAVTTGLRRGEVLGLQWAAVDLEAGTLTVSQSLSQTKDGVALKAPKTSRSRRVVLLPAATLESLTALHAEVQPEPGDYVVRGLKGGYWKPNQFSVEFHKTVRGMGLSYRYHDLRHAHASQLLALGIPVPVVSARLGHSDSSTTLRVYAHALPGQDGAAVAALDAAFAGRV